MSPGRHRFACTSDCHRCPAVAVSAAQRLQTALGSRAQRAGRRGCVANGHSTSHTHSGHQYPRTGSDIDPHAAPHGDSDDHADQYGDAHLGASRHVYSHSHSYNHSHADAGSSAL